MTPAAALSVRKMLVFVFLGALFYLICTLDIAWTHSWTWVGAAELSIPTTMLAVVGWLWPLLFESEWPLWRSALSVAGLSLAILTCYAWLINSVVGPDHPMLTIFGAGTRDMFADDAGIVYSLIEIPVMSIVSGLGCFLMLVLVRGGVRVGD